MPRWECTSPTPTIDPCISGEAAQRRLALNVRTTGDLGGTADRLEKALKVLALPKGTVVKLGGKIEDARETQKRPMVAIGATLALVIGLLYLALGRWPQGQTKTSFNSNRLFGFGLPEFGQYPPEGGPGFPAPPIHTPLESLFKAAFGNPFSLGRQFKGSLTDHGKMGIHDF
jgi:hypothetical protein